MRPQTIADLTDEQREGAEFFRIDTANLPADGHVITAIGKMITRARTASGTVRVTRSRHGDVVARLTLSDEELEERLKSAQDRWDYYQVEYDRHRAAGTKPDSIYGLARWCQAEGLPLPWEADR